MTDLLITWIFFWLWQKRWWESGTREICVFASVTKAALLFVAGRAVLGEEWMDLSYLLKSSLNFPSSACLSHPWGTDPAKSSGDFAEQTAAGLGWCLLQEQTLQWVRHSAVLSSRGHPQVQPIRGRAGNLPPGVSWFIWPAEIKRTVWESALLASWQALQSFGAKHLLLLGLCWDCWHTSCRHFPCRRERKCGRCAIPLVAPCPCEQERFQQEINDLLFYWPFMWIF